MATTIPNHQKNQRFQALRPSSGDYSNAIDDIAQGKSASQNITHDRWGANKAVDDNIAQGKPASQSTVYSGWGADKAVDGVIGKDVDGGSCSSTNPKRSREAWWEVDLQHMSRIKSINVTYRELYPFRLSGFYIYVSNTTVLHDQRDTWHLCYHDDIKDPDLLPSFNQSRPCIVDGRYVIFFNKRPADNEPKNHRYYSSTNAVVELCEVQVFGCPINRFGLGCDKRCYCGVGGCDPDTGLCDVTGCQSGWTGQTCSDECGPGLFGVDCRYTCHCLIPGCNKTSGTCTVPGCKAGWKGNACDSACGPGTFGRNCLQTCHCAKLGCNHVHGICNEPGCAAGWTGLACNHACSGEHFGMDCKHTCHCAFPGCDRFYGICTYPGCIAGWNGPSCDRVDDNGDESIYVNTASLGVELACDSENQHKVQHKQQDDTQEVDGEDDEVIYVNNPTRSPVIEDTKLKVTDLHKIIAKKQNDDAFDTEYQNLPHGLVHPHDTSKAPENVIMNRFKTTFAYDHSRVILRKEKESCSDYINANYIEDTKGVKAYIATQGPKETTLEDFWRMAWQNESGKIVMLANLVELGKKKCCNYWARNDGEALQLGLYQVTLQEEVTYAFHTIRNLSVKNKQFSLNFHSAGIGRTGTYIGLDALLKEGENNDKIDVFAYTNRMRKDRMNMIQTLNQYKVLHEVLAEGLTVVSESMTGSKFSKKVLSLFAEGKVEAQFKVLEKNKPNYKVKETALSRSNKQKNKDIAIPAVEKYRIYLTSAESNYINAVNIPDGKPWPTDTTHLETFGDFTVQYDKSQSKALDSDLLVERKLSLHDKRTTTETVVTVHETSSWKGKGSLPSMKSMLELIQHVLTLKSSVSSTIVLACPDGATDSGLLCVLCNVMERLEVDGDIDIMAAVRQIQIRRPQCLSDKEQYQFCYNVMKEHMETASIYAND
ncbi:receptor-type tyrosine-protein phosphatase gamma-like [Ylistrum balloti]|uniref:receptor-type tyrosine-protein phosphatase gamma-like n=1 Tax=Ylistrum balloti TaxID=509963 RepID=UPI002905DE62|nr:receptor-type tyrosine-protein phosphatase gamma-like [Ylistrum balloti]